METNESASDIPPPAQPSPIISLNDLMNAVDVIKSKEEEDKHKIQSTIVNVDEPELKNRLISWGIAGFPSTHVLYSIQLSKHGKCSDGIIRDSVLEYYNFLVPEIDISTTLNRIQDRLPGMILSYSYTDAFLLQVHISKTL